MCVPMCVHLHMHVCVHIDMCVYVYRCLYIQCICFCLCIHVVSALITTFSQARTLRLGTEHLSHAPGTNGVGLCCLEEGATSFS